MALSRQVFGAEMRAKLEGLPALNRPYRLMIALKVLFEVSCLVHRIGASLN